MKNRDSQVCLERLYDALNACPKSDERLQRLIVQNMIKAERVGGMIDPFAHFKLCNLLFSFENSPSVASGENSLQPLCVIQAEVKEMIWSNEQVRRLIVRALSYQGRYVEALKEAQELKTVEDVAVKSVLCLCNSRRDDAERLLATTQVSDLQSDALSLVKADLMLSKQKYDETVRLLEKLQEGATGNGLIPSIAAHNLALLELSGFTKTQGDRYEAAIKFLKKSFQAYPQNLQSAVELVYLYVVRGDYDLAEALWRQINVRMKTREIALEEIKSIAIDRDLESVLVLNGSMDSCSQNDYNRITKLLRS